MEGPLLNATAKWRYLLSAKRKINVTHYHNSFWKHNLCCIQKDRSYCMPEQKPIFKCCWSKELMRSSSTEEPIHPHVLKHADNMKDNVAHNYDCTWGKQLKKL